LSVVVVGGCGGRQGVVAAVVLARDQERTGKRVVLSTPRYRRITTRRSCLAWFVNDMWGTSGWCMAAPPAFARAAQCTRPPDDGGVNRVALAHSTWQGNPC
jgi:hypothetical protein